MFSEPMPVQSEEPNGATDVDDDRRRWRKYNELHRAVADQWRERGYTFPPPQYPTFPDDLRALTCGAKTRKGTPCKRKDLHKSGRCKLHGGLSTGPRTEEGREGCRQAALRRWAKVRVGDDGTP